jgi:hypothetical protein
MSINRGLKTESSGLKSELNASLEVMNGVVTLKLTGDHGNPLTVIFGGADGILITIDSNGVIRVTPPEGPGDPELLAAFKSLNASVTRLSNAAVGSKGVFVACQILASQMDHWARIVETKQFASAGVTQQQAEQYLASATSKYTDEGCNK